MEEEDIEDIGPTPISKLEDFGINQADIKKLKDNNIQTVEGLLSYPKKNLIILKGITDNKIDKIIEAACKLCPISFTNGLDMFHKKKSIVKISTGSIELNKLLGGGIETQSITEIFGEFRTGKTQLCHTLCVTGQLPVNMGGGEGRTMFIDTEGTFRPERIVEISDRFALQPEETLENIAFARATNTDMQLKLVQQAAAIMMETKFSLVVVDSSTALYRSDYVGRGELSVRQNHLSKFMRSLQRLADEFSVAVVITNQVMSSPDSNPMMVGDQKKPIGGNIIAHASTTRLYLRKGRGDSRVCKIYDSPSQPEAEATYCIGKGGIEDFKD